MDEKPTNLPVTVVVPVHDPGPYVEPCLRSLVEQSMSPQRYEVILVDDGSTDGTAERLDEVAAAHPHVRVVHTTASGGPGRPRNLGLDLARGEYVYFLDHDDWLGPEALERMYTAAAEVDADILIGKVVGHGRGVARELFRASRPRADLLDDGVVGFLTPHKLFRTALLRTYGIRFVEGRQWLEDHRFVVAAYARAATVSVLADYVCCHWVKRAEKGTNLSARRFDARGYFRAVRDVLDLVDTFVPSGIERDRWYAHWFHGKLLRQLSGRTVGHALVHGWHGGRHREIRRLTRERFGPAVDRWLPVSMRLRAALLRSRGRRLTLARLAAAEHGLTIASRVRRLTWKDGELVVEVEARLRYADGAPVVFRRDASGRVWWEPPIRVRGLPLAEICDVTDLLPESRLWVYVRHRDDHGDYPLPGSWSVDLGHGQPRFTATARFAVDSARLGSPAEAGIWDPIVRLEACGWGVQRRPARSDSELPDPPAPERRAGRNGRIVRPYWTQAGNLSIRVGR
ncbi:MAG TPA: glycosyltransferase family 2 protein [Actinopolymorphaceae bacterium]